MEEAVQEKVGTESKEEAKAEVQEAAPKIVEKKPGEESGAFPVSEKAKGSRAIIEANGLKVVYNLGKSNEVRSLSGVDIKIYPQEYVIIFGPSGCGKSTLLYSISGLQAPTNGWVSVSGKRISQMNKKEMVELHRFKIGMIFQAFYLIPSLTVIDNVCLPKTFCGVNKGKRREEGIRLLRRFSIVEQASKFPHQLSGGQKQRVSIARSLINNPDIILADEPVGNLDSESTENVMQILKDLNEVDKKTIILVTHNPEHLQYADRVIHMKDGKVVKEEIYRDKRPEYVVVTKEEVGINPAEFSPELKILMRTFKNLSPKQIGALLVPYKANQVMSYVLSDMNEEQVNTAGAFLKEFLFGNISLEDFEKSLDMDLEKGGAGWNKKRAVKFAERIDGIAKQVQMLNDQNEGRAVESIVKHLVSVFDLKLGEEAGMRLASLVRFRTQSKIDQAELRKKIDDSFNIGGVGLRRNQAEKVAREIEMIMLLKYTV